MSRCRVLVADPPWKFGDALPGEGRGAAKHYPLMTVEELISFPMPPLADDAVLALWRVSAMQREALDVVDGWGFTQKSELVWSKLTKHGKRWFGMGRHTRMSHEVCLLCVRGRPKVYSKSVRSWFEARVGRHSEKPDEFFDIIHKLYGYPDGQGSHVELFSRRSRPGWLCYGNELTEAAPSANAWWRWAA